MEQRANFSHSKYQETPPMPMSRVKTAADQAKMCWSTTLFTLHLWKLYAPKPTAGQLQVALQVNYLNAQGCPVGYCRLGVIIDVPRSIHALLHNTSSAYSQCHYTLGQPNHSTRPGSNIKCSTISPYHTNLQQYHSRPDNTFTTQKSRQIQDWKLWPSPWKQEPQWLPSNCLPSKEK